MCREGVCGTAEARGPTDYRAVGQEQEAVPAHTCIARQSNRLNWLASTAMLRLLPTSESTAMTLQEAAMVRFSASSAPTGLRDRIHITGGKMKVMGLHESASGRRGLRSIRRNMRVYRRGRHMQLGGWQLAVPDGKHGCNPHMRPTLEMRPLHESRGGHAPSVKEMLGRAGLLAVGSCAARAARKPSTERLQRAAQQRPAWLT